VVVRSRLPFRSKLDATVVGRAGLANLAGALVASVYFVFIERDVGAFDEHVEFAAAVAALSMAVALPVGGVLSTRAVERAQRWVYERRTPSMGELVTTLGLPGRLAAVSFSVWLAVAGVVAVSNVLVGDPAVEVVRGGIGVVLAGLVTCMAVFLLTEPPLRPLFAAALAHGRPAHSLSIRRRLLATWAIGSGVPLLTVALTPIGLPPEDRADLLWPTVFLATAGLVAGWVVTMAAARSVADPVRSVQAGLQRVTGGDLDVVLAVDDGTEIGTLQDGFNRMVAGLRERRQLRDLFGRHVGDEVARQALERASGLGGEQREASALFVDLIGSSAMAEVLPPDEVVATLNSYFAAVVDAASAEGGWVNKFEGDAALCVFGVPAHQPDHAARALRAATAIRDRLAERGTDHPGMDAGIGVSSGSVVAGNVGTEQRYEYTVIGRPVNEASRLSELAKGRPARVLASGAALDRAGDEARRWVSRGSVALRGHRQPTALYEPSVPIGAAPMV
jgi:adenylate cyclase